MLRVRLYEALVKLTGGEEWVSQEEVGEAVTAVQATVGDERKTDKSPHSPSMTWLSIRGNVSSMFASSPSKNGQLMCARKLAVSSEMVSRECTFGARLKAQASSKDGSWYSHRSLA